jgi:type III pantothenate kinase
MMLCFDFGNTLKKMALYEHGDFVLFQYITTFEEEDLKRILGSYTIDQIIISSVIEIPDTYLQFLSSIAPVRLLSNKDLSNRLFSNSYDMESLGMDRKMLALGAIDLYPNQDCLIISLGTCITYNLVSKDKEFCGGVISLGLEMRAKALHQFTEKLPHIDWSSFSKEMEFGKNTQENLALGIVRAVQYELEGFIHVFKKKYPAGKVVLTGGDALFMNNILGDSTLMVNEHLLWFGLVGV